MSSDDNARLVRRDPVARVILRALHKQDMRTLAGERGDIVGLALITAAKVRAAIEAVR